MAASLVVGLFGKAISEKTAHRLTIFAVFLSFVFSGIVLADSLSGAVYNYTVYNWAIVGTLNFEIGFLVDKLTAVMLVVVNFVSLMVHIYTIGYMSGDRGYKRFFCYISLFTFAMHMLVMSNNFLQLFFGWEAVGVVSYLLIGFWFKKKSAVHANLKAFLVNRVGDFGFLLGIGLVVAYAGSLDFSEVFSNARNLSDITIGFFGFQLDLLFLMCCCLFIGAMGKSAQIPLHVWLPDSMEGPTPISALIHAATMVTAGIFMVARLSPIFELSQSALSVIFIIGGFTAFFTGILGMFQNDIKRIVAYSTLSQLGYMTVALGCSAYSLAIFHLVTHAFFKALLFLGAGSVIIGMHHEQDIRKMGGLYRYMPLTYSLMLIGSLSLMGIPFLSGFYSKDLILLAVNERVGDLSELIYWFLNIGVIVTAFYSTRLMLLVFHGRPRFNTKELVPKESPAVVWVPLLLLAIPSIFLGGLLVQPFVINNFLQQEIFVMEGNNIVSSIFENFSSAFDFALHGFYSMPIALVAVGILLAVGVYKFYPSFSNDCNDSDNYFFRLFREKYFFDLFYLQILVKNVIKVGERLYAISERILIDRLMVHGTVNLTKRLAGSIKISQTGFVFHYAIGMISGIAIFLWWFIPAAEMS